MSLSEDEILRLENHKEVTKTVEIEKKYVLEYGTIGYYGSIYKIQVKSTNDERPSVSFNNGVTNFYILSNFSLSKDGWRTWSYHKSFDEALPFFKIPYLHFINVNVPSKTLLRFTILPKGDLNTCHIPDVINFDGERYNTAIIEQGSYYLKYISYRIPNDWRTQGHIPVAGIRYLIEMIRENADNAKEFIRHRRDDVIIPSDYDWLEYPYPNEYLKDLEELEKMQLDADLLNFIRDKANWFKIRDYIGNN